MQLYRLLLISLVFLISSFSCSFVPFIYVFSLVFLIIFFSSFIVSHNFYINITSVIKTLYYKYFLNTRADIIIFFLLYNLRIWHTFLLLKYYYHSSNQIPHFSATLQGNGVFDPHKSQIWLVTHGNKFIYYSKKVL